MRATLLALALVVLAGCTGESEAPAGPALRQEPRPERVDVPIFEEYTEREALERAEAYGLTARVVRRFEACRPAGMVIDQTPAVGRTVPPDRPVILVVANRRSEEVTCTDGIASEHDHDIARLMYAFSRDPRGPQAPWAPRVTVLGVGGRAHTTFTERQAADPGRWRFAEPYDYLSILDVLAASDGRYRVDVGPHAHCAGPVRPPPRRFDGRRQISITPAGPLASCLDWWVVDLFVNDVGQIEGVGYTQWEW